MIRATGGAGHRPEIEERKWQPRLDPGAVAKEGSPPDFFSGGLNQTGRGLG